MSFINQFLELTESLPRKIVRLLKLLEIAEERTNDLKYSLESKREQYLLNLTEKPSKKNITLKNLKSLHKELLSLSDYKTELIKEIKYIIESSFLNKLSPIIQEGKNDIKDIKDIKGTKEQKQQQLTTNNPNKNHKPTYNNNNSNNNSNNHSNSHASYSTSKLLLDEENKKNVGTGNKVINIENTRSNDTGGLLNKKKHRPKILKKNKDEISTEPSNKVLEDIKLDVYCKCKRESYGKMIQCDNPQCAEWFHYECIGIKEGDEPEEWYCSEKCKEIAKKMKKKIPKLK